MDKAPDAFRTISEVADELDLPQHVLRFWESRFTQIRPMKRGGGRRYYRPDDVALLRGIRHLLYGQGYTIRGVQRILRERGVRFVQMAWDETDDKPVLSTTDVDAGAADDDATEGRESGEARGLFAVLRTQQADSEDDAPEPVLQERREPTLSAPRPKPPEPRVRTGALPSETLRQLNSVLDDLAACRRVLVAALEEEA